MNGDLEAFRRIVESRRSVRVFDGTPVPESVMNDALDLALLAPNSDNLQAWEFHWVRDPRKKAGLVEACFSQPAARTAAELVVCVARTGTWLAHSQLMLSHLEKQRSEGASISDGVLHYYRHGTRARYGWPAFGRLRAIWWWMKGLSKPVPREPATAADLAIWAAKTSALACENLMLALRAHGYDSCPMEGFDSWRVRRILGLPRDAHITMIVSAGKRAPNGVYGPRVRFERGLFIKTTLLLLALASFAVGPEARAAEIDVAALESWADVPGARSMVEAPDGTIYVGTRDTGKVYAVGADRKPRVIADGLNQPNGVAWGPDGKLYVAEISRVSRLEGSKLVTVYDQFPTDAHHGWKFIAFGPDGLLYVPVGAPCNECDRSSDDERYASITRMKTDGSKPEVFARGIRNTVGFAWRPKTRELWFTDNGRDLLGDNVPPDELNRAPRAGMNFGYPYCHGGTIVDPDLGAGKSCASYEPPVQKLGPHVAALGMRFVDANTILIAEHGSWNRSTPIGYRVTRVKLDAAGKAVSYEPYITGWLKNGKVSGRPVDLIVRKDGSLLISDDLNGKIWRLPKLQ